MSDIRLERAGELLRSGKVESARELLEPLIKEDRQNISAWQLYAESWPKVSDKIRVWEVCLRHNPSNPQAQQALALMDPRQQKKSTHHTTQRKPSNREHNSNIKPSSQRLLWGSIGLFIVVTAIAGYIIWKSTPTNPSAYHHTQPVEYYLYVPKDYSADQDWPLFIGVHGSGGSGLDCWNLWQHHAEKEGFILLCPSIPGDSYGFQQDVGETTMWSAIGAVKQEYRIKTRMFMTGFSAGAFFIQGFTYHYPQSVSGLSILSSGFYLDPSMFPQVIPMTIVIGDADDPRAVNTSQLFANDLKGYGFDIEYELMPGVGHTVTKKGINLTIELFRKINNK